MASDGSTDETSRVDRMAMRVVRSMYKLLPSMDRDPGDKLLRHIKTSESAPRLAGMLSLAAKLSGVPVRESDLDQDPWLFNVLNGTLDLRTGTLRTHAREDLITNLSETEYDANAVCPRWERFLQEIFQNDVDIMGFVKRMAGYMLTGDTREECLFVLVGKGQNGKGKLIDHAKSSWELRRGHSNHNPNREDGLQQLRACWIGRQANGYGERKRPQTAL